MVSAKERAAKALRIISVPPVTVTLLFLILAIWGKGIFTSWLDVAAAIALLGFLPAAAYPVSALIAPIKRKGREGQRNLAFAFSAIGYVGAWLYSVIRDWKSPLAMICSIYLLSVILLLIINKAFHLKASGHACSITGPLVLLGYFFGLAAIVPCIIVYAAVIWASLKIKRHTPRELAAGTAACLVAGAIVWFYFTCFVKNII